MHPILCFVRCKTPGGKRATRLSKAHKAHHLNLPVLPHSYSRLPASSPEGSAIIAALACTLAIPWAAAANLIVAYANFHKAGDGLSGCGVVLSLVVGECWALH
jgi:hypothetical protein